MALALARKYRPRNFSEVAVQNHVSHTLRGAIARDRVAHGYLFCGPRGTGKTTLARVLAMALNCENKGADGEPCGSCQNCQRIWSGSSSLDVIEIDAASNRGVDDARDLRERAMYAPSGDDRYKVYIVDEAHMLTREAWNALLKVLEEPPPRVIFVFATTEPEKIAQAAAPVLSRLQRFDLKRIGSPDIIARLSAILKEEGIEASNDALTMIARAADGSMRDSLSLLDQVISIGEGEVTPDAVRDALGLVPEDEFLAILDIIADGKADEVFPAVQRLADAGVDFGTFLTGFADMARAQLSIVLGGKGIEVSELAASRLIANREKFAAGDLLRILNAITEIEPRFRKSGQQQLIVEMLLIRFALADRTLTLEQVLTGLGRNSGGGDSGSARAGGENQSESTSPGEIPDWRAALRASSGVSEKKNPNTQSSSGPIKDTEVAASEPPTAPRSRPAVPPPSESTPQSRRSSRPNIMESVKKAIEAADMGEIPERLTDEQLKEERVRAMRDKDPVFGTAIDALDLELMD